MQNFKNNRFSLGTGEVLKIIAPSESFETIKGIAENSSKRLSDESGVLVDYLKKSVAMDMLKSNSTNDRVKEFHKAFRDTNIKAVLAATGGYNSNDLLNEIDWDLVKQNPKIFIGSSDITVLLNAIYAKTGMITYHGPNFYKFGMKYGLEYTLEYFKKTIMSNTPFEIIPSLEWSDDKWYRDQEKRNFSKNNGYWIINEGSATGVIIGGNLCSFNLLQGTEFMPKLRDAILFIEDDEMAGPDCLGEFNRNLQSLLQLPDASSIRAIIIGRFQKKSEMTKEKLMFIFASKPQFQKIPIIANTDFGHTDPSFTFPIGGIAEITANKSSGKIMIR